MSAPPRRISAMQLWLIGLTCAVCVANNYYCQPLLVHIARDIGIGNALSGAIPTITQMGIAAGMLFLLPLGDGIENRLIVVRLLTAQAAAMLLMSFTARFQVFSVAALLAGLCGVVTYLLPAYVTRLVDPERRGRVTGLLATGIMLGIVAGRSLSAIAAYSFGWRVVYVFGGLSTLAMAYLMHRVMPRTPGLRRQSYGGLLVSLGRLVRDMPLLRMAALMQALSFGMFNTLWIGLPLRLQQAPFQLDIQQIGQLALFAIVGAAVAPIVGGLVDRHGLVGTLRGTILAMGSGWAVLLLAPDSLVGAVIGMILVSVGATGSDVSLRSALYGLAPDIRMRLNAVYSAGTFLGGSLFSLVTPLLLSLLGWQAVVTLAIVVIVLLLLLSTQLSGRTAP